MRLFFSIILSACVYSPLAASESEDFPYTLNSATDAALLAAGCAAGGTALYFYLRQPVPGLWEAATLNKKNLNPLDRQAVGRRLRGAGEASGVLAVAASVSPLFLALPYFKKNETANALTLAAMYAEAAFLIAAINGVCKGLVQRKRPYLYVNNIFERSPRDRNSSSSFYSLHASLAFGSMVFLSTVICDLYDSNLKYLVFAGALPVAGLTGYLRVAGGLHFPTDIIAGAIVGSVIGYLVPSIHKIRAENIAISVALGSVSSISIGMRF